MKHLKKFNENENLESGDSQVEMKLDSYYGPLSLVTKNGNYFISLDSHSTSKALKVDKSIYDGLLKLKDIEPISWNTWEDLK